MGEMEDLYREIILEHFKSPHNKGNLPEAGLRGEGNNPLCGDEVSISLFLEGNKIKDIKFEGHGCAISQSAASMMTDAVKGKSIDAVKLLAGTFKGFLGINENRGLVEATGKAEELGEMAALEGVKKYPVRIKCAVLPWNTLLEVLQKDGGGSSFLLSQE